MSQLTLQGLRGWQISVGSTATGRKVITALERGVECVFSSFLRKGELVFIPFTDGVWTEHICRIDNHIPSAQGHSGKNNTVSTEAAIAVIIWLGL